MDTSFKDVVRLWAQTALPSQIQEIRDVLDLQLRFGSAERELIKTILQEKGLFNAVKYVHDHNKEWSVYECRRFVETGL